MLKLHAAALALLLALAGCSSAPPAPQPAAPKAAPLAVANTFTHWQCAGNTPVQWRYTSAAQEQVDLRIGGDDIMHRLSKRPAGLHSTYSDGLLAFELQGNQGRVYRVPSGKHVDYDCKAQ